MTNITNSQDNVVVIMVPFPAQGHLNQLLQLSCLVSSYHIPVYYVGSSIHNRQARSRINGLNPVDVARIHFHDLPTLPFAAPPPNPNSSNKFPAQLQPAWTATSNLREPVAAFLREMCAAVRRVVIIHDVLMAFVAQDIASIPNGESYAFNCISALSQAFFFWEHTGRPFPVELQGIPTLGDGATDEFVSFVTLQYDHLNHRVGDIHNTSRLIEAPYLDLLDNEEVGGLRKNWAIGPLLPTKVTSDQTTDHIRHECLPWLDKQDPNSVIYVTFGTSTSLSDEQVHELAMGLECSKVKFLWVLRDADKGDVFDGEVRRPKLPDGFEERVKERGLVLREWAPQPEILAHPSTGGFMSHCGWNSCMESITMGVPIAAWPMHSDQPLNTSLVTNVLKTGLVLRDWTEREEIVQASSIENAVRTLMASEEGTVIRKRAVELGAKVRHATEEGGLSKIELDSFVSYITR